MSEADGKCVHPAFEMLEERGREVRQVFADGRHAAEQATGKAVFEVRRHPLRAVAIAAGIGALAGCMAGFAFGWWAGHRD
ncbi:MAG: hypothetical protein A3H29_10950 [Acidobacteria bacterium RIFCSPLOWO2_02_FULL_67_21]|nr:MAG: hypothetical protein A3H29_10950 [Acidobacteria bacterium RIFCSPLOWO2_02_FULL_67_21]